MSTLKVSNIENPSTTSGGIAIDTSGHVTVDGVAYPSAGSLSGRNRIINGDMRIDQRNAGASGTANGYTVDRFSYTGDQASKITWQQNAGSVTPPAGFTNYLGFTTTTAYSVGASETFRFEHSIEGLNVSDLAWGTANAQAVTISFWVRSSLTGTHGATLQNSARSRSYPFTWSISSANTWEYKTITIAGDTSGTWLTNNGVGIRMNFNLGAGATLSGTAGSWSSNNYVSATGATSVVGTNGATFYITGVQLEAGTVATPFERRSYGDELQRCQRYHLQIGNEGRFSYQGGANSSNGFFSIPFPTKMRATPSFSYTGTITVNNYAASGTITNLQIDLIGPQVASLYSSGGVSYSTGANTILYNTAAGNGELLFSAEL